MLNSFAREKKREAGKINKQSFSCLLKGFFYFSPFFPAQQQERNEDTGREKEMEKKLKNGKLKMLNVQKNRDKLKIFSFFYQFGLANLWWIATLRKAVKASNLTHGYSSLILMFFKKKSFCFLSFFRWGFTFCFFFFAGVFVEFSSVSFFEVFFSVFLNQDWL